MTNPIEVEFQSKAPHRTLCLKINHPEGDPPKGLLTDLGTIGWLPMSLGQPGPLLGRQDLYLGKKGSGLFGDWTSAEKRIFMRYAMQVLEDHGFVEVYHVKLTLADCL